MRSLVGCLVVLAGLFGAVADAKASFITFIPPTDPTGAVFTTNTNDAYSIGRGMSFVMLANDTIDSVGIYHDLTGINLSFELAQTLVSSGNVTAGQTILRSGSALVTTAGLQFIDFSFAPLTLLAGNSYHFEFTFTGNGNQNFFHTQQFQPPFNQGAYTVVDGTAGGNTSNFVIPRMRVNSVIIPEPSSIALLGLGAVGLVLMGRRQRRRKLAA